ncbi:Ldh family oxidoreductase [Ancylobacter sp. 6x-1]|uniref:Ldh family oxidoreductase n=1 Tax=Ancylobacter crimeensis TaxID=2579147 RepID=A0ABT0DBT2_9HYPH|nr:Ldh family oxidoreductase [Ancylobacter crimeensis]MCK0197207.1 Ldh family oxidoreductase [Ancylobacter crimeensis]
MARTDSRPGITLAPEVAQAFATAALEACGARPGMAASLARATVAAEMRGNVNCGFGHLNDYIDALVAGRIRGAAEPVIEATAPGALAVDVQGGLAQHGFDLAVDDLAARAKACGAATLALKGSYTTGELGDYALRLAERGLIAFAATNGPPLLGPEGVPVPVYCTNPMAFAAPGPNGPALLIDQASSASAFVNIRGAAARGENIPAGWAVDKTGAPTQDPAAALEGHLLPFGGARGANIALMVEILAAGLSGANWSLDAPDFLSGSESPGVGLFVLAIAPRGGSEGLAGRIGAHLERLAGLGVHVPGPSKFRAETAAAEKGIVVDRAALEKIAARSGIAVPA